MNIVDTIIENARHHPDHPAILQGDQTITYRQLIDEVLAVADALRKAGIAQGHRIAVRSPDGADYVIKTLAVLKCGAAVVPVTHDGPIAEVQETIARIDVHGVLSARHLDPVPDTQAEPDSESALPMNQASELAGWTWQSRSTTFDASHPSDTIHAAFIRFSSGTTGASKGVVLSHQTILDRTAAANQGLRITPDDRILWVLRMQHHFVVSILLFLRQCSTIIIANQDFPFGLIDAARHCKPTLIYASPVHFDLLTFADTVTRDALSNVRLAISTAMKLSSESASGFHEKFGIWPAQAYGIIEVGLPCINLLPDAHNFTTVGKPLPDYQVRIEQPDDQGVGRVWVTGHGICDAYFQPWQTREAFLQDGWFDTADLGRFDDAGQLHLLSRSKNVIISAGMKIFPEEVEAVINQVPGVAESLVFAQEDPSIGEVPAAWVVTESGTEGEQVINAVRQSLPTTLASYKVPKTVELRSELPKTLSGKLKRRVAH